MELAHRPTVKLLRARALLPSAITNESPVIENNRCARTAPIYEGRYVVSISRGKRDVAAFLGYPNNDNDDNDNGDDGARSVYVQLAGPAPCETLSNLRFRATATTPTIAFIHPPSLSPICAFVKGGYLALYFSVLSPLLFADSPYSYSYPIYAPRNCEIHYRITA